MGININPSITTSPCKKANFNNNSTVQKINLIQLKSSPSSDPITVWASRDQLQIIYNYQIFIDEYFLVDRLFSNDPELSPGLITASSTSTSGNLRTQTYDVAYGDVIHISMEPKYADHGFYLPTSGVGFITKDNDTNTITINSAPRDPDINLVCIRADLRKTVLQNGDIRFTEYISFRNDETTAITLTDVVGAFIINNDDMPVTVNGNYGIKTISHSVINPKVIPTENYEVYFVDSDSIGYFVTVVNMTNQ